VLIVLGIAGVAVVLSEALFAPPRPSAPRPSAPSPTSPPPSSGPSPIVQSERHTNAAAGYSFLRPAGWEVSELGTVSELTGPDHDVSVSFGLGPDGGLWDASADLAASIEDTYDGVLLEGPRREDIAGRPAIVVGGRAVNDAGVAVRFLAITMRVEDENYAISVFVADASDPVRVLPSVEDIIASFEVA
jgi:hypothetical protein